ncbi:MAG: monovalent cation/H(+) antiporter subunit G [Acidimicrobiia bacterium]|nr:monovalent cation/H(+) antiporter subunit G [Acidimicrobiia bacterium]
MIGDVLGSILMAIGAMLMVVSALGVLRFPGPVARLHAATKAASAGLALVCLGAGLALGGPALPLMVLVALFQLLTAPIAGHLLGRAAHDADDGAAGRLVRDDLGDLPRPSAPGPSGEAAPFPWGSWLLLTVAWTMLWGDLSVGTVLGGAAASVVVVAVVRPGERRIGVRPLGLVRLLGTFTTALVRGTIDVAAEVLTRDDSGIRQAIVRVAVPGMSREALVVTALAVTLTPGSLAVEIDVAEECLFVHVLHYDEDATDDDIRLIAERARDALGTRVSRA